MDVAKSIDDSRSHINNMDIHGNIYAQTLKYWMENESAANQISVNGGYAIGFRFMSYLDNTYNDYSSWLSYYETTNPYYLLESSVNQEVAINHQYAAMEHTYGEDVLEGFYEWLKLNEETLFTTTCDSDAYKAYDLTDLKYAYIYPNFVYSGNSTVMAKLHKFKYKDLYVNIDEVRNYLQNYKNKDVSNLLLKLEKKVKVELYDFNNNIIDSKFNDEFSLVGVSYIKLVGEDTLGTITTHGLEILY